MLMSLRGQKDSMLSRRAELQGDFDSLGRDHPEREVKKIEIRKIDQTLKTDYYRILEENGEDLPARAIAQAIVPIPKINEDHEKACKEQDEWKKEIRKNFKEDQHEFAEEEKLQMERLRQAEERMKEAEDKEYAKRERGSSP